MDSRRTTTVQSEANCMRPAAQHAGVARQRHGKRGGGISPRFGWTALAKLSAGNSLFQGAFLYEPLGTDPQLFALIGGHVFQQLLEAPFTLTDLSEQFGLFMPASEPHAYFVQGEQFLVIQAGDYLTCTRAHPALILGWNHVASEQRTREHHADRHELYRGAECPWVPVPAAGAQPCKCSTTPMRITIRGPWGTRGNGCPAADSAAGHLP